MAVAKKRLVTVILSMAQMYRQYADAPTPRAWCYHEHLTLSAQPIQQHWMASRGVSHASFTQSRPCLKLFSMPSSAVGRERFHTRSQRGECSVDLTIWHVHVNMQFWETLSGYCCRHHVATTCSQLVLQSFLVYMPLPPNHTCRTEATKPCNLPSEGIPPC